MEKIINCRMCGRLFKGHHNAMFCMSCKKERARENSYENWKRIQFQKKERERLEKINEGKPRQDVPGVDVGLLDIKLAKEKGMTYGKFSVWKVYHEQEYIELLEANGYVSQKEESHEDNPMDKF